MRLFRLHTAHLGTALALLITTLMAGAVPTVAQDGERISRPGVYQGYSEPIYHEWVRLSQYVEVRDGTRLAVDIYRPAIDGVPVEDPLPLIWTHHRYHRADVGGDGTIQGIVDDFPELGNLIRYGYIVAAVDVRGGGASFGVQPGPFSRAESLDAYDMTEWFAAQPWCSGNIGMFGLSYLGITQYMAASTQPPHLKAIFPMMAMFDMYDFAYPGGVFQENFVLSWGAGNVVLDKLMPAAPVDEDINRKLLDAALNEHTANWNVYTMARDAPFRDTVAPQENTPLYTIHSPSTYLEAINKSGVAIYTLAGWYDMYPRDAVLWFNNLTVPQKLLITPWSHNGSGGFDLMTEHLRWFDYWLKGIDNGIMDEPPILYRVMGAPEDSAWRMADQWPLTNQQPTPFYVRAGPSGSVASINDGLLSLDPPGDASAQDDYVVDYTTTTGTRTRWTDGYGAGFGYPEMILNDEKGLTYTTPPLEDDTEITGHPIAHLWISTTAGEADVMVYLEEVDANGRSTYITEGVLKASHRATADAPWAMIGLPFHRGLQSDLLPVTPGEIMELVFDLHPTSNIFDSGNRIRITITGADADTYLTVPQDPPPTLSLYRSTDYPSSIMLPLIPAQ